MAADLQTIEDLKARVAREAEYLNNSMLQATTNRAGAETAEREGRTADKAFFDEQARLHQEAADRHRRQFDAAREELAAAEVAYRDAASGRVEDATRDKNEADLEKYAEQKRLREERAAELRTLFERTPDDPDRTPDR